MIKQALAAAVERVLDTKRSTDVLREVLDAKRKRQDLLYSFCGHQRRGQVDLTLKSSVLPQGTQYRCDDHGV